MRSQLKQTEFLPLVHDFEVFLRDHEMFEAADGYEIDENGQIDDAGVGYRGVFRVENAAFSLKGNTELIPGHATVEGTAAYAARSSHVHSSSFTKVKVPKESSALTLSKLMYGTNNGQSVNHQDFFGYLALRYAILSGGVNQIETGHSDRE